MGPLNIGRRDDYIVFSLPTSSYDDDGKLVTTGSTTIEAYGDVQDRKSALALGGGQRRDIRSIFVSCDSRDIAGLTIDYTAQITGSTTTYQVADIFQDKFRFSSMVELQYIK